MTKINHNRPKFRKENKKQINWCDGDIPVKKKKKKKSKPEERTSKHYTKTSEYDLMKNWTPVYILIKKDE